jgi:hypothetical protein
MLAIGLVALVFALSPADAFAGPLWDVKASWGPTDLSAGSEGQVQVQARNLGDEASEAPLRITDRLPAGVTAKSINWQAEGADLPGAACSGAGTGEVECSIAGLTLGSLSTPFPQGRYAYRGYLPIIFIDVEVSPAAAGTGTNVARVEGGDSASSEDSREVQFGLGPAPFGVVQGSFLSDAFSAAYPAGEAVRQAGAHPFEQRVDFELAQKSGVGHDGTRYLAASGLLRSAEVVLPRGFIGNPQATPKCSPTQFAESGAYQNSTGCPADTQVGYLDIWLNIGPESYGASTGHHALTEQSPNGFGSLAAIYNLTPPKGETADFGFNVAGYVQGHIYATLDPEDGYAIKTLSPEVSAFSGFSVRIAEVTFWGVPADPAHDRYRYYPRETEGKVVGAPFGSAPIRPLLTTPTDCGVENGGAKLRVESYQEPGLFSPVVEYGHPLDVEGCRDPRFRFEPEIALLPTDTDAGAPTGLEVKLDVPQRSEEAESAGELYAQNGFVKGIATPPIKKTVVTMPEGMTLNPSAGQGLSGCSLSELGMSPSGIPNDEPVTCPVSAQIGTLVLHTPELPATEPMSGRIFIARQSENPFQSLFALYLVIEDAERGILVKVPGQLDLNPATGQITTTFDDLPQFPVSDMQLKFKSGPRAALVNPSTCGTKTMRAEFYSWQAPTEAHVVTDSYQIAHNPDGSPCPASAASRPFAPVLTAGTTNPLAGAFSPFTLRVTRDDDEQEFARVQMTLPPGLLGKLAGVAECPEANIARAQVAGRMGAQELAEPSCPASSQIGTSYVGVGTGPSLTYVPGRIYLAGPYKGAPFSVVVITPSVVGPYDLGVVTVRGALYIDSRSSQVRVVTDPLPQILDGIPVRIRDLRVSIDRPGFTFNPTSCSEQSVTAELGSFDGASAGLTQRFQAADCATLAFGPKFSVSTSAHTSRLDGASLNVKLSYPAGSSGTQANVKSVKVELPKALPSQLKTLQKACTAKQFNTDPAGCPPGSVVGHAVVHTQVLSVPLEGPAYFVSNGGEAFPNLIVVLQGDGVTVQLVGDTDIKHGITSSTFASTPDVPFESFALMLTQGEHAALTAIGDLCRQKLRMPAAFVAQNGARFSQGTGIQVEGCSDALAVKSKRVKGRTVTLGVWVPAARRLTVAGKRFTTASKSSHEREEVKLALHVQGHGRFTSEIRLTFTPTAGKDRRKLIKSVSVRV